MFLGVDRREHIHFEPLVGQRAFAAVGVAITVGGLIALMARSHWVSGASSVTTKLSSAGQRERAGHRGLHDVPLRFEATAALLIIAVVGAVLLARRESATQGEESA